MLSALKKLVGSESGQLRERHIPAGLQSMNQSLQRRFAKGVQYNSEEFLQPLMMTCAFREKMHVLPLGSCLTLSFVTCHPVGGKIIKRA